MTISTQTMTDDQRKALILEYFNTFDRGGIRSTGEPILSLFADDCMVWFPKWGMAKGVDEVGRMFGDLGEHLRVDRSHHLAPERRLLRRDDGRGRGTDQGSAS